MSMAEFSNHFYQAKLKAEQMGMIHVESRHVTISQMNENGEEHIYKEMIRDMLVNIPMYALKEFFPLEIKEDKGEYSLSIRIETK